MLRCYGTLFKRRGGRSQGRGPRIDSLWPGWEKMPFIGGNHWELNACGRTASARSQTISDAKFAGGGQMPSCRPSALDVWNALKKRVRVGEIDGVWLDSLLCFHSIEMSTGRASPVVAIVYISSLLIGIASKLSHACPVIGAMAGITDVHIKIRGLRGTSGGGVVGCVAVESTGIQEHGGQLIEPSRSPSALLLALS
eukprot:1161163-Pelagomonas_calceolata.AAC.7